MFTLLLAATVAGAAPAGFSPSRATDSCQLFLGQALPNGVVPMRAECRFAKVDLPKLDAAFSDWSAHDAVFSTVLASEVRRRQGAVAWVHQVHAVRGVKDREGILKMERTVIPGGFRYAWTLDNGDLTPSEGRVLIGHDDGFWEITADPEGGVRAIHQLAYDPGGSVPGFLVRWFQTSGLQSIVEEMEAWASAL